MKSLFCAWGIAVLAAQCVSAADVDMSGFIDARYGVGVHDNPIVGSHTLGELRSQLSAVWYHDLFTLTARSDFLYDDVVADRGDIDLERGEGFVDLRELNLLFTPLSWADVKVGRQILTWGTGDLLFINDLFPKDWKSFFAGRDDEYLKAPSDALFVSFFPSVANIDVAYTPRFDADRYIDGERFSYWGGMGLTGEPVLADRPDAWGEEGEVAIRLSRMVAGWTYALYGYDGFWKSPQGFDQATGRNTFPALSVYGASARGALSGGIGSLEVGYYDSREDRDGADPFVPDCEVRLLAGYEHEIVRNLTGAAQYYLEHAPDEDENRHLLTVRLTQMLMNQNLILGLFAYWSPSDDDGYLRPRIEYKLSDNWKIEARGNIFVGKEPDSFFGQFEDGSNVALATRYSF